MNEHLSPPQWIREEWSKDPQESDVLFPTKEQWKLLPNNDRGPWQANASLHIKEAADSYAYVSGYRRGAQVLAEVSVGKTYETNVLVYPILYLYRHAFELHLKRIIPVVAKLVDQPLTPTDLKSVVSGTHRLDRLWALFEPRLEQMRNNMQCEISDDQLKGIRSYIRQFNEVDEGAECFRFASSRDGQPHLKTLNHINIIRTTQLLERLGCWLENFDETIHEQYDNKCEWLWEAQQEAARYEWE